MMDKEQQKQVIHSLIESGEISMEALNSYVNQIRGIKSGLKRKGDSEWGKKLIAKRFK